MGGSLAVAGGAVNRADLTEPVGARLKARAARLALVALFADLVATGSQVEVRVSDEGRESSIAPGRDLAEIALRVLTNEYVDQGDVAAARRAVLGLQSGKRRRGVGKPAKSAADVAARVPGMPKFSLEMQEQLLARVDVAAAGDARRRNGEIRVLLAEALDARDRAAATK